MKTIPTIQLAETPLNRWTLAKTTSPNSEATVSTAVQIR